MATVKLFAGLGNPGTKYENTRHNFGFMALDAIASAERLEFKNWNDVADISFYDSPSGKVFLLKPMTYMNLSGQPLSAFMKYYKIKPEEICVFYDDFSIPLGQYRARLSGSAGGHNGISSIIEHLHTDVFARLKLGIGPLPEFMKMPDFVLSRFQPEEKNKIEEIKKTAVSFFTEVNKAGIEKAVSGLKIK